MAIIANMFPRDFISKVRFAHVWSSLKRDTERMVNVDRSHSNNIDAYVTHTNLSFFVSTPNHNK